jgi:hypothetical protein
MTEPRAPLLLALFEPDIGTEEPDDGGSRSPTKRIDLIQLNGLRLSRHRVAVSSRDRFPVLLHERRAAKSTRPYTP